MNQCVIFLLPIKHVDVSGQVKRWKKRSQEAELCFETRNKLMAAWEARLLQVTQEVVLLHWLGKSAWCGDIWKREYLSLPWGMTTEALRTSYEVEVTHTATACQKYFALY